MDETQRRCIIIWAFNKLEGAHEKQKNPLQALQLAIWTIKRQMLLRNWQEQLRWIILLQCSEPLELFPVVCLVSYYYQLKVDIVLKISRLRLNVDLD